MQKAHRRNWSNTKDLLRSDQPNPKAEENIDKGGTKAFSGLAPIKRHDLRVQQ